MGTVTCILEIDCPHHAKRPGMQKKTKQTHMRHNTQGYVHSVFEAPCYQTLGTQLSICLAQSCSTKISKIFWMHFSKNLQNYHTLASSLYHFD